MVDRWKDVFSQAPDGGESKPKNSSKKKVSKRQTCQISRNQNTEKTKPKNRREKLYLKTYSLTRRGSAHQLHIAAHCSAFHFILSSHWSVFFLHYFYLFCLHQLQSTSTLTEWLYSAIVPDHLFELLSVYCHHVYWWYDGCVSNSRCKREPLYIAIPCLFFMIPKLWFIYFISWYQSMCLSLWHQQTSVQTRPQKWPKNKKNDI